MSSATSIKRGVRLKTAGEPEPAARAEASPDNGLRPMHFFVLASLIMATAAVVMSGPSTPEHLILISLIVAAAGAAAAGFYRMLAPLASDEAAAELSGRLSERSRGILEREKMLVLRSIKELEFDRAMNKMSQRDFDDMSGRLRARALVLMKQIDEGGSGYRDLIERELWARLSTIPGALPPAAARPAEPVAPVAEEAPAAPLQTAAAVPVVQEPPVVATPVVPAPTPAPAPHAASAAPGLCASCRTANDADAAFCKRCGTRLARGLSG